MIFLVSTQDNLSFFLDNIQDGKNIIFQFFVFSIIRKKKIPNKTSNTFTMAAVAKASDDGKLAQ